MSLPADLPLDPDADGCRRGISRLGPEARQERARKAARARWDRAKAGGRWELEAIGKVEEVLKLIRNRPGTESHVRNLERLLSRLKEG